MSTKSVKKNIISLFSGLAIIGGTIGASVSLANMSSYNKNVIAIEWDDLIQLRSNLVKKWLTQELTANDFENLLNNSPDVISNEIINEYNKISSSNNFDFTMTYKREGELFSIILKPKSSDRFSLLPKPNNINTDIEFNGNIVLNNIKLWTGISFDNTILTSLRNEINNYIFTNKFSLEEFISNCLSNENKLNDFKKKVQKWTNNLLPYEGIQNIIIDSNNTLTITSAIEFSFQLTDPSKYFDDKTTNLVFDDLEFFANILLDNDKLNNLESTIQNYIDEVSNRFSVEQFSDQINSIVFKNMIAAYLEIDSSLIDRISYENKKLIIFPKSYNKFTTTVNNGNLVDGNIELITNFEFYNTVKLLKLDSLYNSINNLILENNKKYTISELQNYITINYSLFKDLVVNNLFVSETETINPELINKIILNANGDLSVELVSNYFKYDPINTSNVQLINNYSLVINNLDFYTDILIEDTNISNLKKSVQDYIDETKNRFSIDQFENEVSKESFKDFISSSLGIQSSQINSIQFNNINNILNISAPSLMKYSSKSNNSFIVDGNISINDLKFYSIKDLMNLENLYNAINGYIKNESRLYTSDEFKKQLTNNYDVIKKIVSDNLYVSNSDTINPDLIESIQLNLNNQLEIVLNTNYLKYITNDTNNVIFENNNQLVVKNLEFYTAIEIAIDNINSFKDNLQNYINESTNQFTTQEFENQINFDTFKTFVSEKLGVEVENINSISFDATNNLLTIVPNNLNKYVTTQESSYIVNGQIKVSSLKFYDSYNFNDLEALYTGLNSYIDENDTKYTLSEFKLAVKNYPDAIKKEIAKNLSIFVDESIDSKQILNISMKSNNESNENNELVINLSSDFAKYSATSTTNVIYENNSITVKNLKFYKSIKLDDTKLSSLVSNVQSYINLSNNRFSISEFNSNYTTSDFKVKIASYLGINSSSISHISFDQSKNRLTILPANLIKYIDDSGSDLLSGGNIVIDGLNFYQTINVSKQQVNSFLSNFENNVRLNLITYNNLNNSELVTQLKTDLNLNLDITASVTTDTRNSSRYKITVKPNGYYNFNYNSSGINKVDGSFVIDDVGLMNSLQFTSSNLSSLRTSIQNFINNNNISNSDIFSRSFNVLKNVIYSNLNSGNTRVSNTCVNSISYSYPTSSTISLTISPNTIDYYSFGWASGHVGTSNYTISNGNIVINNLSYVSTNYTSSSYFNWSGNFIMSLTSAGRTLSSILFPSNTTGINDHIFDNDTYIQIVNINHVSNSLTTLPNSLFYGCTNLRVVILKNTISNIGVNTFQNCRNLTMVSLPTSITIIQNAVFAGCSNLPTILIPNNVTEIGYNAFQDCTSLFDINFGTGVRTIQNAAFAGCSSLKRITLPSSLTTINWSAFNSCTSLLSVQIPDNISFIASNAFEGSNNVKLYVNNSTVRNKVLGFNLTGISPDNVIVGSPN